MVNLPDLKRFVGRSRPDVITEGKVFRFHTILTTVFLLSCSLIITIEQNVSSPIKCIVRDLPYDLINSYCWSTSTYTIPETRREEIHRNAPVGILPDHGVDDKERIYHTYYQWVNLVLLLQAVFSYFPKWLWNTTIEDGLIGILMTGMTEYHLMTEDAISTKERLLDYIDGYIKYHRSYAFKYWCCELLSLFNILGQMYFLNAFFDGQFYDYGLGVFKLLQSDNDGWINRNDAMGLVFPRMTKCAFKQFGQSGSIQHYGALCILPLNAINEKAYILIWFWFVISAVYLTILAVYRLTLITRRSVRPRLIQPSDGGDTVTDRQVDMLSQKMNIGDWWILHIIKQNTDMLLFRDILIALEKKNEYDDQIVGN